MTIIKPFKAVLYNQEKIENLADLVCPPYDAISPKEQKYYHELNLHNFIHILLGFNIPHDNKYRRAARFFNTWIKSGIFIRDEKPAIYFYSQDYKIRGEKKTRAGFIALLGLETANSSVYPHEHTRLEPREDRFKLLRAVKANLSPIFVVFSDKKRIIKRVSEQLMSQAKPLIDITDENHIRHKLWRFDSHSLIGNIERDISAENIFIADGHHRYEVACTYQEQMRQKFSPVTGEESFNYVMAYFTNVDSRGLVILPVHRLLKLSERAEIDKIFEALPDYFDIEEIKDKTKFFFLMEKAGRSEHVIGLYHDKRYRLLRLKNIKILDKIISDKPKEYRSLDVAILNHIVFEKIIGIGCNDKENIVFSQNAEDFIEAADSNRALVAFFLNPATMEQIMSVALTGNRMPPKSTYFYPKVLSGLVINKFDK